MITVEKSRSVAAPIAEVWSLLADFDRLAEWADNADHTCWLDAADRSIDDAESDLAANSTGHSTGHSTDRADARTMVGRARRVQAGRVVLVETITIWDPPARLAYDLGGLPPIVKSAVNEWRLAADAGSDSTVVTLATHVDCGPRRPQQLIAWMVGRRLAAASDVMLEGLAAGLAAGRRERVNPDRWDNSNEGVAR